MEDLQQAFFDSLDQLPISDRVLLKRSCGKTMAQAGAAVMMVFYRLLPENVGWRNEERWFAAACCHCLEEPDVMGRKPLAEQLRNESFISKNSNGIRRGQILMDTEWDNDGYFTVKLVRLVKFLKQKGYPVDCSRLLTDLLRWNYENKPVQKEWAKEMVKMEK